ncbi:RecBCD enzyme subunit RecB [mine drainage metagenome]|uniref:RecBCD enzyme subunit RecB n=1 Tax=mine drainage metagenome TaxID=410659 RepID=A0A1J5PLT0_9ZZZZ
MEFWLPADDLPVAELDQACAERYLGDAPRTALTTRRLRGLLMGFADLVFEADGRWWVLDYKSNALGADDAAYDADALRGAVARHRYDVQLLIYQLALHRLLRARLGSAYDPARHLGGGIDLFLRGSHGPVGGCFTLPADVALLQRFDALLGSAGGTP